MMNGWDFFRVQLMGIFGVFSLSFGIAGYIYGTEAVDLMFIPLISGLLLISEMVIVALAEENKNDS